MTAPVSETAPASEYGFSDPSTHDPAGGRAERPKPNRSKATAGRSATSPAPTTGPHVNEPDPNPWSSTTGGIAVPPPTDSTCTAQPRCSIASDQRLVEPDEVAVHDPVLGL